MGTYVDPGNERFREVRNSRFFVDKSGLINQTNSVLGTWDCQILVSRPEGFGKSTAIAMLEAYYSFGCESLELFQGLEFEKDPSFEEHLNRHHVISADIGKLYEAAREEGQLEGFSKYVSRAICWELAQLCPEEVRGHEDRLYTVVETIQCRRKDVSFVFLFDNWDVILRDEGARPEEKESWLRFLLLLFKNSTTAGCIDLAYLTGVLPIPRPKGQTGLNNFYQYTVLEADGFAKYVGFTEGEVEALCRKEQMPLSEIQDRYGAYEVEPAGSLYRPASVVQALEERAVQNRWPGPNPASALTALLNSNDPSFLEAVRKLLAGVPLLVWEWCDAFDEIPRDLDSLLTELLHLGYLTGPTGSACIPNMEVAEVFLQTLAQANRNPAHGVGERTEELVEKTLAGDGDPVARILEDNHNLYAGSLPYNREDDLAFLLVASYGGLVTRGWRFQREFPDGKGFADVAFFPPATDGLPILVEMKWDDDAQSAIRQIQEGQNTGRLQEYSAIRLVDIRCTWGKDKPGCQVTSCVIQEFHRH